MITKVFSVFDDAVKSFAQPFFAPTKESAIRSFRGLVEDKNALVNKYPHDYSLFELGEYDDQKGTLTSHMAPIHLGGAFEFMEKDGSGGNPLPQGVTPIRAG